MTLLSITEFIGHFHPLLVHLPIGILLIALLLQWLSYKEKYHLLKPAIKIILLIGTVSAALSCVTGYMLSQADDYDETTVTWHLWMALGTFLFSFLLYLKELYNNLPGDKRILSGGLLIFIAITGHLGGSLTHGSGYITQPLQNIFHGDTTANLTIKPLANVQEAMVYADIVKPILQTKCIACHNDNKQKGGLRMDNENEILKGGKDGKILQPGNAEASELIKRIMLPVDNDKHMPPKEKTQPSESQLALLHWWINTGADFYKKVNQVNQSEKIKPILVALQQPIEKETKVADDFPPGTVEKADEKILAQLRLRDIIIMPIAQESNYLSANFVIHPNIDESDLKLLSKLNKQLIWLRLDNTNLNDNNTTILSKIKSLFRLNVANTKLTDKGLDKLTLLTSLRYLNLTGTSITTKGILKLKDLKKLKNIYVYKTNFKREDYAGLKKIFPLSTIDTGGYVVGLLDTDTTKLKSRIK